MIGMLGAKPVRYSQHPANGMRPQANDIRPLITSRTRAILINSPSNPTGAVIEGHELVEILKLAAEAGIFVISDEIYEDLVFESRHHSVLEHDFHDLCLYVSGVSKSYAMTGFRLGWCVLPERLVDTGRAIVEATLGCVNTSAQFAALAALQHCAADVASMRDVYRRRRALIKQVLAPRLCGAPDGAFYAMVDIGEHPGGSLGFAKDLLKAKRVAVAPGITFGPDWDQAVRIAYAVEDRLLEPALKSLSNFIEDRIVGAL
jgi:aspartate/methionine/tyrosine aminotransferase